MKLSDSTVHDTIPVQDEMPEKDILTKDNQSLDGEISMPDCAYDLSYFVQMSYRIEAKFDQNELDYALGSISEDTYNLRVKECREAVSELHKLFDLYQQNCNWFQPEF